VSTAVPPLCDRSVLSSSGDIPDHFRARSDAEFCSKIGGALQEADESQLWIELLREDCGIDGAAVEQLHQETNELIAILATMASKTRRSLS
jgi:four helix bundle protein